jgi:hypothetical protein
VAWLRWLAWLLLIPPWLIWEVLRAPEVEPHRTGDKPVET